MKQINVITENGIKPCKTVGNPYKIRGEMWQVCKVPVYYMNVSEPIIFRKVVHIKTGGTLPLRGLPHNAPAKDYFKDAENFLRTIPEEAIKKELNNKETIN